MGKLTIDTQVWVLYGPSAEWGDGTGVLGIYESEEIAREGMHDEKVTMVDFMFQGDYSDEPEIQLAIDSVREGSAGKAYDRLQPHMPWPNNMRDYYIEPRSLAYLGIDESQLTGCASCGAPPEEHAGIGFGDHPFQTKTMDDILEELNIDA